MCKIETNSAVFAEIKKQKIYNKTFSIKKFKLNMFFLRLHLKPLLEKNATKNKVFQKYFDQLSYQINQSSNLYKLKHKHSEQSNEFQ